MALACKEDPLAEDGVVVVAEVLVALVEEHLQEVVHGELLLQPLLEEAEEDLAGDLLFSLFAQNKKSIKQK